MTPMHFPVAYLRWQARDALLKALVPLGFFLLMVGLPIIAVLQQTTLAALKAGGDQQRMVLQAYDQMLPVALLLGAILLMSGISSLDRERQHVRFLFSRPITPWAYYLQHFLIATALYVAGAALLPLLFGVVVTSVPVLPVVRAALLSAFFFGSLGFLCAALLNRDGIVFILVMVVGGTLQQIDAAGQLSGFWSFLADVLPPVADAGAVRGAWTDGRAADTAELRLVLAYSLGMLVTALLLVRHRPLVR